MLCPLVSTIPSHCCNFSEKWALFSLSLHISNDCSQAVGEFSADATRWALADAGDGMDDANFETAIANAAILRMTKELVFIEESLSSQSGAARGWACCRNLGMLVLLGDAIAAAWR